MPSEGPVKSASEVIINDRNRLWAMGGESGRIQAELLVKIVQRGVFILQRKGLIRSFFPGAAILTPAGLAYDTGLADRILHRGHA